MSDNNRKPPSPLMRNLLMWAGVLLALVLVVQLVQGPSRSTGPGQEVAYSDFLKKVDEGQVREVAIAGRSINGTLTNDQQFRTHNPGDAQLIERLRQKNVRFDAVPEERPSLLQQIIVGALPFLLMIGIWIFFMRQMQNGQGRGAMGFGKSRARLLTEKHGRVTFDDVAGIDEAREELQEIVDFLKDPSKFHRLGGKIPKGALLVGPPGTGKTLLARAIAGEANVPFFTISGSDFVEMFVGVGASRVRDMFEQAKKNAPCIIFIDEIDAVGRHRGAGLGGGNDEREQTLNQLLVEMDGFEANEGIIIVAATNRPDVLDPALLRPGRFDRQIVVGRPDIEGREKILAVHMRKVPLAPDVNARVIARGTPGFSGADLANLVNEAALLAARRGKRLVSMSEFEDAKDKVMMGVERKSMVMTEEEKKLTAYHEAGHALVSLFEPASDPIHKATIIPRGRALGLVMSLPEGDRYSKHKSKLLQELAMAMGGRAAEEIIFGEVTTGAQNDLERATAIARSMVTEYGMSRLGRIALREDAPAGYLGGLDWNRANRWYSEATAKEVDSEIRRILSDLLEKVRDIMQTRRQALVALAERLMEKEVIDGDELRHILKAHGASPAEEHGAPPAEEHGAPEVEEPRTPTAENPPPVAEPEEA